ncbi:MAG: FG-GAP-like repeat-containing protein, partial [Bacteroidota bacterium]
FQSSVDYALTFGLADVQGIDSVQVEWPGGAVQTVSDVALRSTLTLDQAKASYRDDAEQAPTTGRFFRDITVASGFEYVHEENAFADFNREPLIPKMLSTEGPTASVGDVNGDGRLDVFIGGPRDAPGKLLLQEQNSTFLEGSASVFEVDKVSEDAGSAFFDADGDGDLDLYVASGGSEFSGVAPALQDRLYLNDGRGGFTKSSGRIPRSSQSGSVVQAHDFDGDGDQDLFVGGRSVPWKYGIDPESRLLVNDGGTFTDQTEQLAPELVEIGLVTDAVWTDADQDGRTDLFVAGEWMAPTLFKNTGRGFEKSDAGLAGAEGWWNRLHLADLDGDGDQDIVAGNLGLNSRLRAAPDEPVTMHVSDFDRNGSIDQVVSVYSQGESYPLAMRGKLAGQLVFLKKRFTTYDSFAEQSVEEIFTEEELATASVKVARTFASAVFLNNGDGTYERRDLPNEAQRSPLYGLETLDVNQDGQLDIVAAGNFYGVEPQIGRMDALRGIVLLGDGTGQFTPVTARESGFWMTGQVRDLIRLGTRLVALRNDAPAVVFEQRNESGRGV